MRAIRTILLGLVSAALVAGCGGREAPAPGGPDGADGIAGDIAIRDARFSANPPRAGDDGYRAGSDVVLSFTAENEADETDRLLAVTSRVAGGSEVVGDEPIAGGARLASGYVEAPTEGTVFSVIRLTGLREPLRVGRTYPVTFLFERGGPVTLQLPVDPPRV